MSSHYENVIVFGPTGAVGSAAAEEASKRGAKVWLAMRDTSKSVTKELDADKFSRVQADLLDPESVKKAIQTSGATAAFFYLAHSKDAMRSCLQAMKDAGITYVVFLSSFTIFEGVDPRDVSPDKLIPYAHAQVEVQLEDLDISHTALRPGAFATNGFKMFLNKTTDPWEARMANPKRPHDCIVPSDIGKVGGATLVDRPSASSKEIIYLYGPELLIWEQTWEITKEVTNKEIKIVRESPEETIKYITAKGVPPPFAKYLIEAENKFDVDSYYPPELFKIGSTNVTKYAGYEPTKFRDFVATQEL